MVVTIFNEVLGGSGLLDPIVPTAPFAPGAIALGIQLLGLTWPAAPTTFISAPGSYKAHCSSANGANVLQLVVQRGAQTAKPVPQYSATSCSRAATI